MMYNQYPYNIFNQDYVNAVYLQQLQAQRHSSEQQKAIKDMVQAISDYCEAARKITGDYSQLAINACLLEIARQAKIDEDKRSATK